MKKLIAVIVIVGVLASISLVAFADFGDFGGSKDYGGSDSDCGDCGGDLIFSLLCGIIECDMSDGNGPSAITYIALVVIVVLLVVTGIVRRKSSKNGSGRSSFNQTAGNVSAIDNSYVPAETNALHLINEYTQRDPNFDATALSSQISNLYVQLQNCITAKNLDPVRPYFSSELFGQYESLLDTHYRQKNRTKHIERVAVLGVTLNGWRTKGDNDEIFAALKTRVSMYVTDDSTGNIIEGSPDSEKFMNIAWTLTRSTGANTRSRSGQTTSLNCPYCGAPVDISKSAKCDYCDSVIPADLEGWTVSSIKAI